MFLVYVCIRLYVSCMLLYVSVCFLYVSVSICIMHTQQIIMLGLANAKFLGFSVSLETIKNT